MVSLVIPGKDVAPWIGEALASLVGQLPPSQLQVVVVDDGSSDDTATIARSFVDRLPGLEVHRNPAPTGLASARNQGLARAEGEVIGFLDGDDWLPRGHLEGLRRALLELDVDFVRCDHVRVTDGRRELVRAPQARRGVALDPRASVLPTTSSTMVDYPYAWAGLFRRRVLDRGLLHFEEGLHTAEDRPWIWRLHLQTRSFAVVNGPGVMYRRGLTGSLTQILDRRQLDFLESFGMTLGLIEADPESERFMPKFARQFLAVLAHQLKRSRSMTTVLRREMTQGGAALVERLPPAAVRDAAGQLDADRRALLRPVLGRREVLR